MKQVQNYLSISPLSSHLSTIYLNSQKRKQYWNIFYLNWSYSIEWRAIYFEDCCSPKRKELNGKKLSSLVLDISPEDKKKLVKLPLKNHIFKLLSIKGKFTKQVHIQSLALQIVVSWLCAYSQKKILMPLVGINCLVPLWYDGKRMELTQISI